MKLLLLAFTIVSFAFYTTVSALEIGIGTHMGIYKSPLNKVDPLLAETGTTLIRDEITWDKVEPYKSYLTLDKVSRDLIEFIYKHPNQSLIVFGYGNPNYDNWERPVNDLNQDAYANYVSYVLKKIGSSIGFVEIWNEWNLKTGHLIKSPGTPEDYSALIAKTLPKIRTVYSGKILIGGVGGDRPDWIFTKSLLTRELLKKADGYSIHLYNFALSSDPYEMIQRAIKLQDFLSKLNDNSNYPVYITEMGWPTHKGKHGSTEVDAASKLNSFLFQANSLSWIKGVWVYELLDSGTNEFEIEHNFGLFKTNLNQKKGFCSIKNTIKFIKDKTLISSGYLNNGIFWSVYEDLSSYYLIFFNKSIKGNIIQNVSTESLNGLQDICENKVVPNNINNSVDYYKLNMSNQVLVYKTNTKSSQIDVNSFFKN